MSERDVECRIGREVVAHDAVVWHERLYMVRQGVESSHKGFSRAHCESESALTLSRVGLTGDGNVGDVVAFDVRPRTFAPLVLSRVVPWIDASLICPRQAWERFSLLRQGRVERSARSSRAGYAPTASFSC